MLKYLRMGMCGAPTIVRRYPKVKRFIKDSEKYNVMYRYKYVKSFMYRLNETSFHQVFYIDGQEDLPKGQVLFVCNHTSNLDPIDFYMVSDRPVGFLAKKETLKMPFVRSVCKATYGTFLDRSDLRSEIKSFIAIDKLLKDNPDLSYFVFPEGHRSSAPDYNLQEYHPGAFKIATKREIPICPVAIYLPDRALKQKYHYKKYPVQIKFMKAIMPSEYENMTTKEIADKVKAETGEALKVMKERDPQLVKALNNYSDKKLEKVLLISD